MILLNLEKNRNGFPKNQIHSLKSIYENLVYAPKLHGEKDKDKLDEIVETSLNQLLLGRS